MLGEIKVLSHPSSVDSIPTSANQEDPVSLAYTASRNAYEVARKLQYIAAIEVMAGVQGLDFLAPLKPSSTTQAIYNQIRNSVATVDEDRHFGPDIEAIYQLIREGEIVETIESQIGQIAF